VYRDFVHLTEQIMYFERPRNDISPRVMKLHPGSGKNAMRYQFYSAKNLFHSCICVKIIFSGL